MRIPLAFMAAVFALALAPHSNGASSQQSDLRTVYDFYLGGIKAGELTINADYDGTRYKAASVLKTAGMVGLVYRASFEAETEGTLQPEGHVPGRFAAASRMKSKKQFVEITYQDLAPAAIKAEPAFVPKPWQIEPTEQVGTLDPISAALAALAPVDPGNLCNTSVEVFDGRRRYAVDLGAPEPDGPRIKCAATYRRIAGFKPKMMKKRAKFPFNVWFEERPDGKAHFVRAAGESVFGVAVILLRD